MARSPKARVSFPQSATILFFFSFCFSFALTLAGPPSASTPPLSFAIISGGDHGDAFAKVIRSLCDGKRSDDGDETASVEQNCHSFQDAREVSSALMRDPQAFDAIFVEDRECGMHVADFAALAGVPVVRFAHKIDEIDPAFERPAVLVLEVPPPASSQNYALKEVPYLTTAEMIEKHTEETLATLLLSNLLGLSPSSALSSFALSSSSTITSSSATRQPAFTCRHLTWRETLLQSWSFLSDDFDSAPLGLTMIVKDEAGTIGETVRSAAPHVDYWTIMDTGSTDGTQSIVQGNFSSVPGQLIEKPFVDFATSRNDALRAHGARTAYVFMPDADFTFENLWRLRTIAWRLERECRYWSAHVCGKSMRVIRQTADMELQMQVVFPTSRVGLASQKQQQQQEQQRRRPRQQRSPLGELEGWHYHYPVHEVSALGRDHTGEYIVVPGGTFKMRFMTGRVFHTKSEQRWRDFDIRVLEQEKAKRPKDARVAFYLARTYNQVGDNELALAEFQRRVDLGGWYEEVFHSLLEQGRILARMGRDPTEKLKQAHQLVPNRAEPLFELARWEQKQVDTCKGQGLWLEACRFQHRALGYTYAKYAAATPYPDHSTLFVSTPVYDRDAALQLAVHGYFLAELAADVYRKGKEANDVLASRFPGREPYASNIKWYGKLKSKIEKELFSGAQEG